jgi:hypothetical protein
MLQKDLYNGIPNVTVWRVLRKSLHLKVYKQTMSSLHAYKYKIFVTLAKGYDLEYHFTAHFETPSV